MDRPEDLRARLMLIERPGIAKAAPLSEEQIAKLEAKAEFAQLLDTLELDASKCARLLGKDESTVRSWLDRQKLTHNPPTWAIRMLGKEARLAFVRSQLDELQMVSNG